MFIYEALGKKRALEVKLNDGATIKELLNVLRRSYNLPDEISVNRATLRLIEGEEIRDMIVLKNGRNIKYLDGAGTRLEEGNNIALFPPVAGG
jgi:molybdopterin synthase sulfur carrier subunit